MENSLPNCQERELVELLAGEVDTRNFGPGDDASLLAAWNAWKEVCWIHALGKPRRGESIVGTVEDEARLSRLVAAAFLKKLIPYTQNPLFRTAILREDWARVFDNTLFEYEHEDRYVTGYYGDPEKKRKKKAWKDFVWKAVSESEDPPLKVIVGKLLGPLGIIHDIADDWLLSSFSCHFDANGMLVVDDALDRPQPGPEEAKNAFDGEANGILDVEGDAEESLDKPQSGLEEGGYAFNGEDIVPTGFGDEESPDEEQGAGDALPDMDDSEVPDTWKAELEKAFSARLCCLVVAHIHGVKVYDDTEVLDALGIAKTTTYTHLKRAEECLAGLDSELADWMMHTVKGTRFFKKWLIARCRTEKAGGLILSRVEANNGSADIKPED